MDSETLERMKRDMGANRFSEAALTVISLEEGLALITEIERLQQKAANLHKAADAIANQIMEEQGFGAEYDEEGYLEVKLNKAEVEDLISVILNWEK